MPTNKMISTINRVPAPCQILFESQLLRMTRVSLIVWAITWNHEATVQISWHVSQKRMIRQGLKLTSVRQSSKCFQSWHYPSSIRLPVRPIPWNIQLHWSFWQAPLGTSDSFHSIVHLYIQLVDVFVLYIPICVLFCWNNIWTTLPTMKVNTPTCISIWFHYLEVVCGLGCCWLKVM